MPDSSNAVVELASDYGFDETLARLTDAIEGAHLKIFARIGHSAEATQVGLSMPPTTVLIYGNPRGGTPLMLAAPAVALDLPLRVLVRADADGRTVVAYHPAATMKSAFGLADAQLAGFIKLEGLIASTIKRGLERK
jgi:uncharacterized protein (DUF302 family)